MGPWRHVHTSSLRDGIHGRKVSQLIKYPCKYPTWVPSMYIRDVTKGTTAVIILFLLTEFPKIYFTIHRPISLKNEAHVTMTEQSISTHVRTRECGKASSYSWNNKRLSRNIPLGISMITEPIGSNSVRIHNSSCIDITHTSCWLMSQEMHTYVFFLVTSQEVNHKFRISGHSLISLKISDWRIEEQSRLVFICLVLHRAQDTDYCFYAIDKTL